MDSNELDNQKSMRSFLQRKYTKDIILFSVALLAIGTLRALSFISNDVTGSLAGATIGYAMSGLRKLHD